MPRRRDAVTDEAVMTAVAEAIGTEGPGVSLATIAKRAGLSAPRLVQRHGGRDQLILAAFERLSSRYLDDIRRAAASPRPVATYFAQLGAEVRRLSHRDLALAGQWLAFEWASPKIREFNGRFLPRLKGEIAALLRAGVQAGELQSHDSAIAAERLLVHLFGMAHYYPFTADPPGYRRELKRMMDWLIAPLRPAPSRPTKPRRRGRIGG